MTVIGRWPFKRMSRQGSANEVCSGSSPVNSKSRRFDMRRRPCRFRSNKQHPRTSHTARYSRTKSRHSSRRSQARAMHRRWRRALHAVSGHHRLGPSCCLVRRSPCRRHRARAPYGALPPCRASSANTKVRRSSARSGTSFGWLTASRYGTDEGRSDHSDKSPSGEQNLTPLQLLDGRPCYPSRPL